MGCVPFKGQYCVQVKSEKDLWGLAAALKLPNPTSPPSLEAAAPHVGTHLSLSISNWISIETFIFAVGPIPPNASATASRNSALNSLDRH